jgi:hypothetical protein
LALSANPEWSLNLRHVTVSTVWAVIVCAKLENGIRSWRTPLKMPVPSGSVGAGFAWPSRFIHSRVITHRSRVWISRISVIGGYVKDYVEQGVALGDLASVAIMLASTTDDELQAG